MNRTGLVGWVLRNSPRQTCRAVFMGHRAAGLPRVISSPSPQPAPRSGVALIAVLWIVMLAGLVLLGVRRTSAVNLATAHSGLEAVQAHWLARAGVEQALAIMADDSSADDSTLDLWYSDPGSFQDIELETGTFSVLAPADPQGSPTDPRYGVEGLSALINVNTAGKKQLDQLPNLEDAPSVVAAIRDWRDGNENARSGGAERGYYQGLAFPYRIRNDDFQTLEELRLVRGIDTPLFYNEDTNLNGVLDPAGNDGPTNPPNDDADGELDLGLAGRVNVHSYVPNEDSLGQARVDVNSAGGQELQSQLNFTESLAEAVVEQRDDEEFENVMGLLEVEADSNNRADNDDDQEEDKVSKIDLDWLASNMDRLTVSDEDRLPGRLNLNTASREVLLSVPEMTREATEAIIEHRRSADGPFLSVGDLHTDSVVEDDLFKKIAEYFTVRSSVFRIRAVGLSRSTIRKSITVIVDRGEQPMRILYWRQSE